MVASEVALEIASYGFGAGEEVGGRTAKQATQKRADSETAREQQSENIANKHDDDHDRPPMYAYLGRQPIEPNYRRCLSNPTHQSEYSQHSRKPGGRYTTAYTLEWPR